MDLHEAYLRWLYRSGRPNRLARLLNRGSAIAHSAGIWPSRLATLEVAGRRSGRVISFPVVIADYEGERYLVAMLGGDTNWVRNVRAAGGRAVLRHGRRETVRLEEVDPQARPPILRRYLDCAPGARPHIPVDRRASVEEFEQIAPQVPVFRVTVEHSAHDPAGEPRNKVGDREETTDRHAGGGGGPERVRRGVRRRRQRVERLWSQAEGDAASADAGVGDGRP